MILLPNDKFEAWSADLRAIIATSRCTYSELESTLGRLNHVAYITPLARHFLNKLRLRLHHRRHKNQQITLTAEEVADLALWVLFLEQAHSGILMNRVTTRRPSQLC